MAAHPFGPMVRRSPRENATQFPLGKGRNSISQKRGSGCKSSGPLRWVRSTNEKSPQVLPPSVERIKPLEEKLELISSSVTHPCRDMTTVPSGFSTKRFTVGWAHCKGPLNGWPACQVLPWSSECKGYEDSRGHGYDGVAWYHTQFNVPERFGGREIKMNFGGVYGSMVIWVDGQFAAYRPFNMPWWRNPYNEHFDVDLTHVIEAGKDHSVVIRVNNEFEWGGIYRRLFLYSPVEGRDDGGNDK